MDGMIDYLIGLICFITIFGSALIGMLVARSLPQHHLSSETRNAVSVAVAVVGTLAALVIGLMISSASTSFTTRSNEVISISVDLIRMQRTLQRYGSEADTARAQLRDYASAKMQELFPSEGQSPPTNEATVRMLEAMQDTILLLTPTDEKHRWLRSQALTLSDNLSQARWLLVEQAVITVPESFLMILVFWLALVFASFGLFSPRNTTAIVALCLCSMAVAGGITVILEFGSPFSGLIRISGDPMRHALMLIMQ